MRNILLLQWLLLDLADYDLRLPFSEWQEATRY